MWIRPQLAHAKGAFGKHPAKGSEEDYMQYWYAWRNKSTSWLLAVMALTLILGIACGSAAQSPEAPEEPAQPAAPAAAEPAAAAPASSGASAPAASAAPTAVPQQAAEPAQAMAEVADITLTVMVGGWGHRFLPVHGTNCHNHYNVIHDFLIRTDANRASIPGMLSSWELSEDGHTWTATVRDDGYFHDGSQVTGEDLLFTWLQAWGPGAQEVATSSSAANMASNVELIQQIGPQQVSITHANIDSSFEGFISDASGACQGIIRPAGELGTIHDADAMVAYDQNPIGAGIMAMTRQVEDEVMSFERFDQYYAEDRRVPFQFLDLRKIPEESTRAAALRAGEADIAPVSLATKDQVEAGGGKVIVGPEASYLRIMFIGCGWDYYPDLPCNDKRVRQALGYAIDKDALRDDLFGGPEIFEAKGWAHVTPSSIGYSPALDPFPYDPDKARELMAEAGYPNGEGFGKLIVNTWSSRAVPFLPESAQLAANYWKDELGLDTEVRVGDETALKKATKARDPLAGQILWRDNEARRDGRSAARSSYGTAPKDGSKGGNWSHTPEIVNQVQEALSVFDPAKIDEVWHDVFVRLREEHYEMAMGYVHVQWGVGPRIESW